MYYITFTNIDNSLSNITNTKLVTPHTSSRFINGFMFYISTHASANSFISTFVVAHTKS
ncbi:hypothetical protein HanPI659440_Chr11g0408951 [Helianthus annuus]|nr:hypothetical protein HanIR_Chr11g0511931 [Helianthus annuus]KAJ0733498.1 hypothetical protein HanPI659440_Chr11g0408951 [Helianthus annuus]